MISGSHNRPTIVRLAAWTMKKQDRRKTKNPVKSALTGQGKTVLPIGPSKGLPYKEADQHHCNARRKNLRGYCTQPPGMGTGLSPYDEEKQKWRRCKLHGGNAPGTALAIRQKDGTVGMYKKGISVKDMATYDASFDELGLEQEVAVARTQVDGISQEMLETRKSLEQILEKITTDWNEEDRWQYQQEFKTLCRELSLSKEQGKIIWKFVVGMQGSLGENISGEAEALAVLFGRQDNLRKHILHFLDVVGRLRERDQKLKNDLAMTVGFKEIMELIELLAMTLNDTCGNCPNRGMIAERMVTWKPWATKDLKKHIIEEEILKEQERREQEIHSMTIGSVGEAVTGSVDDEDNGGEDWPDFEEEGLN